MITKMAFVSHPTRDMASSKKFFGDILGLRQTASHEDKWCEFDTPDGKTIALDTFSPIDKGPYLALETDNIEKEMSRLRRKGVTTVMDIMDNKVCKMAIIQDPNGHSVMLHQTEPKRLKAMNAAKARRGATKPKAKAASARAASAKATAKPKPKAKPRAAAKAKAKPAAASRRSR